MSTCKKSPNTIGNQFVFPTPKPVKPRKFGRSFSPCANVLLLSPDISPIIKMSPGHNKYKFVTLRKHNTNIPKKMAMKKVKNEIEIEYIKADLSILNNNISMAGLLKSISMEKYLELFIKEEIDLSVFYTLTHDDLLELGITDPKDKIVILDAVMALNNSF